MARRQKAWLKPVSPPGILGWVKFYEFGEGGWCAEVLAGQVLIGGIWSSVIYSKVWQRGFSTGFFWTADPLLLKGLWSSGLGHVLVLWRGARRTPGVPGIV